jgi:pilus assembly protein CpaB
MRWQSWPKDNVPAGLIRKSLAPNAMEEVKGSVVRGSFGIGEPLRQERLVKGPTANFMSAILPAGSRAVSIMIEPQGANSAGGFILPNDHVDVIRTFRDEEASKTGGGAVFVSETLLTNIRVLAVGQNVQERNNERVVIGANATLELSPRQVEIIILAQSVGKLSLSLRSMADANVTEETTPPEKPGEMTVVRFGAAMTARPH